MRPRRRRTRTGRPSSTTSTPDGSAYNVTYGFLRARYRASYETPTPLEPERVYEFRIRFRPTAMAFLPGHRLRVDVSSSDFPMYDRNHNTGGNDWEEAELRPAHQLVLHSADRASHLVLPLVSA